MPQDVITASIVGIQGPPAVADGTSLITATGSTVAATLAERFSRTYFARDWGATGDGSTDDTTAINTATSDIKALGGGILRFDAGVYMATQLVPQRLVIWEGEIQASVELKQIAGTNLDFIVSESFASLTGTGKNYGPAGTYNGVVSDPAVPSWFGMRQMRVNGNGNTERGVCWYGNMQIMQHVTIYDFDDIGLYTEASAGYAYNATDWKAQEEGLFDHVMVRNCGQGWLMRGPHDASVPNFIAALNATWGFRNEASAGLYNGSCHIGKIHTYTEDDSDGQYYGAGQTTIEEAYTDFDRMVIDANGIQINKLHQISACRSGTTALTLTSNATFGLIGIHHMNFSAISAINCIGVDFQAGCNFTIGNSVASRTPPGTGVTAYKMRGSFCSLNAMIGNMTGTGCIGIDMGGSYNRVTARTFSCLTAMSYTPGHHNTVELLSFNSGTNTTLSGTAGVTDQFYVSTENSGTFNSYHKLTRAEPNARISSAGGGVITDARVGLDTSGGVKTYTISGAPYLGRDLFIFDSGGAAGTNAITIDAGTGNTINGSQTIQITTNHGWAHLTGHSATAWHAAKA